MQSERNLIISEIIKLFSVIVIKAEKESERKEDRLVDDGINFYELPRKSASLLNTPFKLLTALPHSFLPPSLAPLSEKFLSKLLA